MPTSLGTLTPSTLLASTASPQPQPAPPDFASARSATGSTARIMRILLVEAGGGIYGIESSEVREIVTLGPVTRLPGAPTFVRGLTNLRGTVLTVADLSARLTGRPTATPEAPAVVVQASGRLLALQVEDVHEVHVLEDAGVEPAPAGAPAGVVCGLGHFGGQVVLLLDIQELARQTLS